MTVQEIMKPNPTSVTPTTPTLEAIDIMRRSGIGCLPVVDDDELVGIVTSYDFLTATASLFKQHLAASARPADGSPTVREGSLTTGSETLTDGRASAMTAKPS
jgi:CBS domain-containing protein